MLMSNGMTRPGLSEDFLNLPGRLVAGGTCGVGGDALQGRNSLRPDASENVGGDPGQKARQRIGPGRTDCSSGFRGIPVAQDELSKRDAVEGGLGRPFGWAMEDEGEREQDERKQGDSESGLHTGMVEGVYE